MSKQTINIGASPNDGTGTPLRTSFDYTNQNFTELYTAVGPSGNNIVVPGTATITGDLDVSGNGAFIGIGRVGLQRPFIPTGQNGTTTLDYRWYSTGTTYVTGARIRASSEAAWSSVSAPTRLMFETVPSGAVALSERYRISGDGLHTWSNVNNVGGTQMTLDGTGLIVTGATITGAATVGTTLGVTGVSTFAAGTALLPALTTTGDTNTGIYYPAADTFAVTTGGTERYRVDSAGNLGIGVTPSAWGSASYSVAALQNPAGAFWNYQTSIVSMVQNAFYNNSAQYIYKNNGFASEYYQSSGQHIWRTVASGTAGNAITFTQAMTLDASGNLLVGKTATNSLTLGNEVRQNGEIFSNQASINNVATTYHVYSTGAAAYRFYVGLGGTVFATNVVISAISDARYKENVQDIDVGLSAILALKPRKFDWKAGKGKDIKGDRGFIAQEFETVFPNLIDEWKDPAPEGEAPYKSVRQDLIPVLVKAIQELTARVQTLEAR